MNKYLRAAIVVGAAHLGACGGGDGEPATFVAVLEPFHEAASVTRLTTELASWGIEVLRYQCGYGDYGKLPVDQRALWADGRTPRLVLVTVDSASAEAVKSMSYPGFATYAAGPYMAVHSDPFDCDPEVEASRPPFGGIG